MSAAEATSRSASAAFASPARRFAAWCIDTPIRFILGLALVFAPMRFLVTSEAARLGSTDPNYLWKAMPEPQRIIVILLWLVAAAIAPWLYTAIMEASDWQATLGKRLFGIRVTDLNGGKASFARTSARFAYRLIPTMGIGLLFAFFSKRRQTLYDLMSGCVVRIDLVQ